MSPAPLPRRYIRHPSGMPLRISRLRAGAAGGERLRNVSRGGLCFVSSAPLPPGNRLHIAIPVLQQRFEADAMVVWCHQVREGFEVGVRFEDPQAGFALRMVEQVCHIEAYRKQVHAEQGRDLSSEEAAAEWIARFAEDFPRGV